MTQHTEKQYPLCRICGHEVVSLIPSEAHFSCLAMVDAEEAEALDTNDITIMNTLKEIKKEVEEFREAYGLAVAVEVEGAFITLLKSLVEELEVRVELIRELFDSQMEERVHRIDEVRRAKDHLEGIIRELNRL